jgi:serine/threonine protein kinase
LTDSAEEFLAHHDDPREPPILSDGQVVGDWRIAAFLGRGGSGEVYRVVETHGAREGRAPARPQAAALKILARNTETARARFLREASLLATMDNPAFPRFFAQGETDGRPYLVMELLEPRVLPSSDAEVADFLLKLCDGVAALHRMGYVHRDIKPGNIMWRTGGTRSCASAVPVLIDLGLVKDITRAPDASGTSLTLVDGHVAGVGTPGYAAPEQLVGDALSPSADIHALGMLANACFDGQPPPVWGRIIDRATGSIPVRRYPDVSAFARAIRHRHWRRNAPAFIAGALLCTAIAIVTCGRAVAPRPPSGRDGQPSRPPSEESIAARERDAWAALCTDVVTNRIIRTVEGVASAQTNKLSVSNHDFLVVPVSYRYRQSTNQVQATIVDLGGRTNVFTNPISLAAGREYRIVGPGMLDAVLIGPANIRYHVARKRRHVQTAEERRQHDPATGKTYHTSGLAPGDTIDDGPLNGMVRLANCTLRNRTGTYWPTNGLFYSMEGHARLEFPNLKESREVPVRDFTAPFSEKDGTVRFSTR